MGSVFKSVAPSTLPRYSSFPKVSIMKWFLCKLLVLLCQILVSVTVPSDVLGKPCSETPVGTPCGHQNDYHGLLRYPQRRQIKAKRVYDVIPSSVSNCRYDSRGRCRQNFFGK